jgi:hypothetical protein
MLTEIPWRTAGKCGAYLMTRFSTDINFSAAEGEVIEGQYAGGRLDSTIAGGS